MKQNPPAVQLQSRDARCARRGGGRRCSRRRLSEQLFRVEARDPVTLVVVTALIATVAVVASWLPARRTLRVEPNTVLRSE